MNLLRTSVALSAIFVAGATGGPFGFDNATLWHAHARLGITRDEFAEVVEHLRLTLEEFGVGESEIATILQAVRSKERLIVIAPTAPPPSSN